jgi:hypothetical protein
MKQHNNRELKRGRDAPAARRTDTTAPPPPKAPVARPAAASTANLSAPPARKVARSEPTPKSRQAPPPQVEEDEEEEEDFDEEDSDDEGAWEEAGSSAEEYDEDDEEDEDGFSDLQSDDVDGDDDSDSSDDGEEDPTAIDVNFDAREMYTRHIDLVSNFIDRTIPDGENLVDRHDFGKCMKASIATTLITVMQSEEDDASDVSVDTAEVMEDEDVYGMCGFVPVGAFASRFESCAGLLKLLARPPEHHVEEGTSVSRLLQGNSARALLFVNDHLNVIPPPIIAQVHAGMLGELEKQLEEGVTHIVMMARLQRAKQASTATATSKAVSAAGSFDLAAHIFVRWEDETYFKHRDKRVATTVFKFPKYVEGQEEQDIPRCLIFALAMPEFRKAVKKVDVCAMMLMATETQK